MKSFYTIPKEIVDLWMNKNIKSNTIKLYFLMKQRHSISQFKDKNGVTYFIMTYEDIQKTLKIRKRNIISEAIKDLEEIGVLKSFRTLGETTKYYMK